AWSAELCRVSNISPGRRLLWGHETQPTDRFGAVADAFEDLHPILQQALHCAVRGRNHSRGYGYVSVCYLGQHPGGCQTNPQSQRLAAADLRAVQLSFLAHGDSSVQSPSE